MSAQSCKVAVRFTVFIMISVLPAVSVRPLAAEQAKPKRYAIPDHLSPPAKCNSGRTGLRQHTFARRRLTARRPRKLGAAGRRAMALGGKSRSNPMMKRAPAAHSRRAISISRIGRFEYQTAPQGEAQEGYRT